MKKPGKRRYGIFIFSAPCNWGGGVSVFHRGFFSEYRQEGNNLWGMFHLKRGLCGGAAWDFALNEGNSIMRKTEKIDCQEKILDTFSFL